MELRKRKQELIEPINNKTSKKNFRKEKEKEEVEKIQTNPIKPLFNRKNIKIFVK